MTQGESCPSQNHPVSIKFALIIIIIITTFMVLVRFDFCHFVFHIFHLHNLSLVALEGITKLHRLLNRLVLVVT